MKITISDTPNQLSHHSAMEFVKWLSIVILEDSSESLKIRINFPAVFDAFKDHMKQYDGQVNVVSKPELEGKKWFYLNGVLFIEDLTLPEGTTEFKSTYIPPTPILTVGSDNGTEGKILKFLLDRKEIEYHGDSIMQVNASYLDEILDPTTMTRGQITGVRFEDKDCHITAESHDGSSWDVPAEGKKYALYKMGPFTKTGILN